MNALGTYFVDEEMQFTGGVVIVVLFLGEEKNQTFPGLVRFEEVFFGLYISRNADAT
jgi:hypothetical protein